MPGEPCKKCGRPAYTGGDLSRWCNEIDRIRAVGGDTGAHNPEWARAICWSIHESVCMLKPLKASTS